MYTSARTYDSAAQQWLPACTNNLGRYPLSHSLYSEWRQRIFRFHNSPSSAITPRDIFFPFLKAPSLFQWFRGAQILEIFRFLAVFLCRSSDTFRKPEYFLPSSETRAIYFLSWPSSPFFTISKETHSERTFAMILFFFLVFFTSSALFISFLANWGNFRWWQKRASESGNEKRGLSDFDLGTGWPTFQPSSKRLVAFGKTLTLVTGSEAITFISFMFQKAARNERRREKQGKQRKKSILRVWVRKKSEQKNLTFLWRNFALFSLLLFCRTQH